MKAFLDSNIKTTAASLVLAALAWLAGSDGTVAVPIRVLYAALALTLCTVLRGWWLLSAEERVRRARRDGRPICGCTAHGVIMLREMRCGRGGAGIRYPRCGSFRVVPEEPIEKHKDDDAIPVD